MYLFVCPELPWTLCPYLQHVKGQEKEAAPCRQAYTVSSVSPFSGEASPTMKVKYHYILIIPELRDWRNETKKD